MSDTQSIIRDLLKRAGFSEQAVDASQINGYVRGLGVGKRGTIRAALEDILYIFQIDAIESDGVIKFIKRGRASDYTISPGDLIPTSESPQQTVSISRKEWFSLPSRVDVVYPDISNDHENSTESAERQVNPLNNFSNIQTAIVLDSASAKSIANTLLDTIYVEIFTLTFNLSLKYGFLEPGDVVTLNTYNRNWDVRIIKMKVSGNLIEIEGITSNLGTYVQEQSTGATPPVPVIVTVALESSLLCLDIPLIDDNNDIPGYFLAVTQQQGDLNWRFSNIYSSTNNSSFALSQTVTLGAVTGIANTALPTGPTGIFLDKSSKVTVTLTNGELLSVTYKDLLNGANSCVVGNELLQFQTATLIAPYTYELSNLLRGRRGTEWAMPSHTTNERFILLGDAVLSRDISQSSIGVIEYLKNVSNGLTESATSSQSFTPANIRQKPFSPVGVVSSRDNPGNVTISWKRRTRVNGGWLNSTEVPLGEATESYQVEIYSGITVKRVISSNSTQIIYTTAQQIEDFGSIQSAISIKIYQMSAIVGKGYPGEVIV